jgi:magnesium transporter
MRITGSAGLFSTRRPPPGAQPGAFSIPHDAHPTRIRAMHWDNESLEECEIGSADELAAAASRPGVTWIEVIGLGDGTVLEWIRDALGVHPLAVADIANTPQRPKFEDYGDRDLLIAQQVCIRDEGGVALEQLSLIAAPRWVLSVVEGPGSPFEPIRERIRAGTLIRRSGADYLAYALIDAVIDGYFPVLEAIGDVLEELEEEILGQADQSALARLHALRRVLVALHRTMWRQRDALGQILRDEGEPLGTGVQVYFRDAHDHALQVIDAVDGYRELTIGLTDLYLSSVSNRLNEVMKTLTIMATIFIPLTFVAGVYGMNFAVMPELQWRWGYPVVLLAMLAIAVLLLSWFRRRGWLGGPRDRG